VRLSAAQLNRTENEVFCLLPISIIGNYGGNFNPHFSAQMTTILDLKNEKEFNHRVHGVTRSFYEFLLFPL
jgi:hypothetical protein